MSNADLEFVRDLIARSRWVFAKTRAKFNPHHYMLRKECDDAEFVRFVKLIRAHGVERRFGASTYVELDVDDHYYWTMGAPVRETILVNRKPLPR